MAEPVPPLSSKDLRQSLLHAYAAHWLGLVPEDKQSAAPASAPVLHRSFFRQPIGSRLPVPRVWSVSHVEMMHTHSAQAGCKANSERSSCVRISCMS